MMTEEARARCADLREHGTRIQTAITDLATEIGASDPLDILAFTVGTARSVDPETGELPPFNLRLHEAKAAAREAGATWRDLAIALGEGDDDQAMGRVRSRFNDNQARLDEMRAIAS